MALLSPGCDRPRSGPPAYRTPRVFQDKRRLNLYRKMGKQDYDHPELYHLTINMERVTMDEAVRLIIDLATKEQPE